MPYVNDFLPILLPISEIKCELYSIKSAEKQQKPHETLHFVGKLFGDPYGTRTRY